MNYAKKLGQKMVKARQANIGRFNATHVHGKPSPALRGGARAGGRAAVGYNGPWKGASSGPAAPGSPMGFGKDYKLSYAQSHVKGRPSGKLRRYRNKRTQAQYDAARVT